MKIEEEIDLKKQNIEELNKELDSLFTKSAIDILKIKENNKLITEGTEKYYV